MTSKAQTAYHAREAKALRRALLIEVPIILACAIAAVLAWSRDWHPLLKAALLVISLLQLVRLPGYFTRFAEHRAKAGSAPE